MADALSRPTVTSSDGQVPRVPTGTKSIQADITKSEVPVNALVASVAFPDVPSMDFTAMARAQDPGELLSTSSLNLHKVKFQDLALWCDSSGGRTRPLVPVRTVSQTNL